jgi:hypothetical protein
VAGDQPQDEDDGERHAQKPQTARSHGDFLIIFSTQRPGASRVPGQELSSPKAVIALTHKEKGHARMTTTVLSDDTATIVSDEAANRFNWGAVIAGAAVAIATTFFLIVLGAGFGLTLMSRGGTTTFLTLGAIYVLAAQAFGFAAGAHVAGRLIGPAVETKQEEEIRAGTHGLLVWAITVVAGLGLLAVVTASGGARLHGGAARSESSISAYWADILLHPMGPHAAARGEDLAQDKLEAARVLAADMHPGNAAHADNRDDLLRLTAMDAGGSFQQTADRVDFVEGQMRHELDVTRKGAGYAMLWIALALLFGAVVAVAAAISARWEDDKINFSMARRY